MWHMDGNLLESLRGMGYEIILKRYPDMTRISVLKREKEVLTAIVKDEADEEMILRFVRRYKP